MRARAWLFFGLLGPAVLGCGNGGQIDASAGSGGAGGLVNGGVGGHGGNGITTHPATTSSTTASSSSGAGGSAPVCPPTPPISGPPINTPEGQWTWVPVTGAVCRDGSPAGIGVRKHGASKKLYIYLEGGGACFNGTTCAISLANFGELTFDSWAATVGQTGIFDDANADNPVKGWNAIYVPYCSGDVHAGDEDKVDVAGGPQDQEFVGYRNMGAYLNRVVPTFPSVDQVLLTGISAGGFGAAFNYDRVASAFCPAPVVLVDDSGPPMADGYLAPCLQEQWRGLWNLASTLPADCSACSGSNGGGIVNYVPYLAHKWPSSYLGLVSSTHDAVISTFFGFGTNDCSSSAPIPGDVYAAGLEDLRQNYMSDSGKWGTYFIDSTQHTWLLGPGFYLTEVNGVKLTQWMRDLLHGSASNIGP